MGIEKPYEVETHRLGPPPGMHAPLDLRAKMHALVVPTAGGVRVAGRLLRVGDDDPSERAWALREALTARILERRPDADAHTWASFSSLVHGMVRDRDGLDAAFQRELIEAIDGL